MNTCDQGGSTVGFTMVIGHSVGAVVGIKGAIASRAVNVADSILHDGWIKPVFNVL